jgi:hypothetical protein
VFFILSMELGYTRNKKHYTLVMRYLVLLLFLSACTSPPSTPDPTPPDPATYRLGSCSVAIQSEAFTGEVTGKSRYTYSVESPLKDLHFIECDVDMQRVGNTVVDATWKYYIRSDTLTEGVRGTFARVEGQSDDLAYLNSFTLIDYATSRATSYSFRTPGHTSTVTLEQNSSSFVGTFSEVGNFGNTNLTDRAVTMNASFNGK